MGEIISDFFGVMGDVDNGRSRWELADMVDVVEQAFASQRSKPTVASSKIKIAGSSIKLRAMSRSWRSPCDKLA